MYKLGKKPMRKTWDASEINHELEEKKAFFVFASLAAFLILIFIFMWIIRR